MYNNTVMTKIFYAAQFREWEFHLVHSVISASYKVVLRVGNM